MTRHRFVTLAAIAAAVCTWPTSSRAAIVGFGDFSGFSINQGDTTGSAPTFPAAGTIELTSGSSQVRSIFTSTPQDISQFTASFTYQFKEYMDGDGTGITFVIENDPRGKEAVGAAGATYGFTGITKSIGVTIDTGYNTTGLFKNGTVGTGAISTGSVDIDSGHPIHVQLAYSGSQLTETLSDTVTLAQFTTSYLVSPSISSTIGSGMGYVGITAMGLYSSSYYSVRQDISDFQFVSAVPEPATFGAAAFVTCLAASGRRRRD